ncbi:hypothetical protein V6N13_049948 [Hibiscus sabdariffa]
MHSLKLIFVLNLVILLTQTDGRKACYEEDRKGLLELKSFLEIEQVNGSDHVLLPSWVDDRTSDCCGWERVTCNSTTGRIVKLSLFNLNGLYCFAAVASDLPNWNLTLFQSFKELKALSLASNCMRWKEKQDLIPFGRLEVLDLSGNQLKGGIPQNIGKLYSLKALYLTDNQFNGVLPVPGLCELRRLQVLDLHNNSFQGTLPPCLSNLTSLKILDLHDNLFSGSITPNSIPSQQFLQLLDISNNDFEGSFSLSSLFNHSKLVAVTLGSRGNKLQIDNGNQAGNPLFQLKELQLSNCNMKNAPHFLLNQHNLSWVDISHSMLNGALPSWLLENNTDLKSLSLRNNSFTGKLDPLPQHPISAMDVSYNYIDGHLPKDFGTTLPNLQYLNLSYNFFEGEVPKALVENCTNLVRLMLDHNNFHGEFFSKHFNLSYIRVLKLGDNEFTGSLITKREFYSGMVVFDVSNNNMTGEIPNGIDASVLLLQNNSFQGQIPCEAFHNAQVIDISHNFLSGPIPSCLSPDNFAQVLLLDLRNNRLSGNILPLVSLLPSVLKFLLLGNNIFGGLIPRQLCLLRETSIMDLSNNSFSGSLPSCLSDVAFGNSHDFSVEFMFSYEGYTRGLPSEKNRSQVVETPLPSDETEEKWYYVDRTSFFASFVATYCVVLLTLGAVLHINPYWRRRWSQFIENCIYSCYYFVVDALRKLATNSNN